MNCDNLEVCEFFLKFSLIKEIIGIDKFVTKSLNNINCKNFDIKFNGWFLVNSNYFSLLCRFNQADKIKWNEKGGKKEKINKIVKDSEKYKIKKEKIQWVNGLKVNKNAFKWACANNNIELAKRLISKKYNISASALYWICKNNNIELLKEVIKVFGKNINIKISTIEFIIESKSYEMFFELLNVCGKKMFGNNVNRGFNFACWHNREIIIKRLVGVFGKKIMIDNHSNICVYAIRNKKIELLKYLLLLKNEVTEDMIYAACNDFEILKIVVKKKIYISYLALVKACMFNNLKTLKFLIFFSNNVIITDEMFRFACENNNIEMLKVLIKFNSRKENFKVSYLRFVYQNKEIINLIIGVFGKEIINEGIKYFNGGSNKDIADKLTLLVGVL